MKVSLVMLLFGTIVGDFALLGDVGNQAIHSLWDELPPFFDPHGRLLMVKPLSSCSTVRPGIYVGHRLDQHFCHCMRLSHCCMTSAIRDNGWAKGDKRLVFLCGITIRKEMERIEEEGRRVKGPAYFFQCPNQQKRWTLTIVFGDECLFMNYIQFSKLTNDLHCWQMVAWHFSDISGKFIPLQFCSSMHRRMDCAFTFKQNMNANAVDAQC